MKKISHFEICILLAALFIVFATGCIDKGTSGLGSSTVSQQQNGDSSEQLQIGGSPVGGNSASVPPQEILAKEINRGNEEYDYGGWVKGAPDPDISMFVDKAWKCDTMAIVSATQWTDPKNSNAELIFKGLPDVTVSPQEAIQEDYGTIIAKGGDVEYGEFFSKYLAEAYYVKYTENRYTYIQLYSFFYPRDVQLPHGPQSIIVLTYKNQTDAVNSEATLTEDAFWKAAQSMYIAKGYREDGSYIPYIPGVDGATVWDGSNQGIVPTD